MGLIEWDESYSVGVKELDEQHKQLFKMLDVLFDSTDAAACLQTATDVLAGLREYADVHFETEERYMAECGYPGLEIHKTTHEHFREEIDNLCSGAAARPQQIHSDTLDYLFGWLTNHVLLCDKKYAKLACSYQQ